MTAETIQRERHLERRRAGTSESHPPSSPWRDRNGRATRFLLPARPVGPVLLSRVSSARERSARQFGSFAVIGAVSTIAYVLLYAALQKSVPDVVANAVALIVTAVGNTAANRRLTFAVQGRERLARDHAAGLMALGVALALTTATLGGLHLAVHTPSRTLEVTSLVAANAAATLARFLLLRMALDRRTFAEVPERIAR